jgi:hypothetical protein
MYFIFLLIVIYVLIFDYIFVLVVFKTNLFSRSFHGDWLRFKERFEFHFLFLWLGILTRMRVRVIRYDT